MKLPPPNRVATYLTAGAGLAAAVAVPLADLDLESTGGVALGLAAILTAYHRWMEGWRDYKSTEAAGKLHGVVDIND